MMYSLDLSALAILYLTRVHGSPRSAEKVFLARQHLSATPCHARCPMSGLPTSSLTLRAVPLLSHGLSTAFSFLSACCRQVLCIIPCPDYRPLSALPLASVRAAAPLWCAVG